MVKKGDILKLDIESLAFGGPGVARLANGERKLVVFIDGVAPGDQVEVEVFMIKRNMAKAHVKKFLKLAAGRVQPKCVHFGQPIGVDGVVDGQLNAKKNCGGCSWQFLSYESQLAAKLREVNDSLTRLGGFSAEQLTGVLKEPIGMDVPWNYRNKMDFSFGKTKEGRFTWGLHMKGRFYDVTEIEECHLFRPWVGAFLVELRPFFAGLKLNENAELMSMIVRTGTNTGETMVNLLMENVETDFAENYVKAVRDFFEKVDLGGDKLVSIYSTNAINKKGQPKQFLEKLLWGKPVFIEKLKLNNGKEFQFEVHTQAFLQPNTKQAEVFYSLVKDLADLKGNEMVFDLFCGTGTIGLCLADKAKKVIGIELNAKAIENAQQNAQLNGVENVKFLVGDVNKVLPEMGAMVDLVIVDPPRAGLTEKIIETIAATKTNKIIYVSCNPASLARDLKSFVAKGFKLDLAQPVDQFCQTYHIEVVTVLSR